MAMTSFFDAEVVLAVQRMVFVTPGMVTVAIFCARWMIFVNVILAIVLFVSRSPKLRHGAREVFWAFIISIIFASSLSAMLLRHRPFMDHPDVRLLVPIPLNASFPSSHTATAVAIACAMVAADPVIGAISIVIALFVMFGRIAVGVHFPSDILGGIVIGLISFALVRVGHRSLRRKDIVISTKRHHHETK